MSDIEYDWRTVLEHCHPIVQKIHADVTDRRGWRQEWECMDADIKCEILRMWDSIVREAVE